jgi:hypothetical protein
MKYLKKRDNYLKIVSERKDLKNNELLNTGIKKIYENEAYPIPLINWGDSLLGRLINSVLRKAQEGINTMKMSVLVKRFKSHFDYIIGMSSVNSLEDSDRLMIARFQLAALISALVVAVVDEKELEEIIGLCEESIDGISTLNVGDDLKSEKENLLTKLKEFKKFLDGLKGEPEEKSDTSDMYSNYLSNFKVVLKLCEAYMVLKKSNSNKDQDQDLVPNKEYTFTGKDGKKQKVKLISLTIDDKKVPLIKGNAFVTFQDGKSMPVSLSQLTESIRLYENSSESSVMGSLKSLYGFVVNYIKVDEIGIFLKMSDDVLNSDKYKNPISKIYTVVRKSNSISENIDNLLTRPEEIGKKISQLYSVTKSKVDGRFDGISSEIQVLIGEFNSTMLKCLSKATTEKTEDNEKKVESVISSYSRFISINELTNPVGATKTIVVSEKIKDYFSDNFDLEKWEVKDEDRKYIEDKMSQIGKKSIIIRGTGPILEVVRLFNRAYKIHTRNAIPFSNRSDGKINVMTMNQWTSFGSSGSKAVSGTGDGPYRNNKLFNMWENSVYDVFKEYEEVFDKGTTLIIGDREKKDAGKALREFMLEMLDGDTLYKSDGRDGVGAQKKAINKYFDIDAEGIKPEHISVMTTGGDDGGSDAEVNAENAEKIKESKMSFAKDTNGVPRDNKDLVGSFFALLCKNEKGEKDTRYFFINSVEGGYLYLTHTRNTWFYQKYLETQNGPKMKIVEKDGIGRPLNGPSGSGTHLVKIKSENFLNYLKPNTKLKLNSKNINGEDKSFELTIQDRWRFLSKESEDGKFSFYKISDLKRLNSSLGDKDGLFKKPTSTNPGEIELLK